MKLEEIDQKLEELRKEYLTALPEKKKFIIIGANLLKSHKQYLIQKNVARKNIGGL